jgi:hypothetical protein
MSYLAPTVPPTNPGGEAFHGSVLWLAACGTYVAATLTV